MLRQSGEATIDDGQVVPVYQCDECLMTVDFLGEPTEIALTFAVDGNGRKFDPAEPDGELHF